MPQLEPISEEQIQAARELKRAAEALETAVAKATVLPTLPRRALSGTKFYLRGIKRECDLVEKHYQLEHREYVAPAVRLEDLF
ncbi:MAG TPA: hypothetical protein VGE45_01110 [Chloroflexia bacterium]|jgi:hypothetical protein